MQRTGSQWTCGACAWPKWKHPEALMPQLGKRSRNKIRYSICKVAMSWWCSLLSLFFQFHLMASLGKMVMCMKLPLSSTPLGLASHPCPSAVPSRCLKLTKVPLHAPAQSFDKSLSSTYYVLGKYRRKARTRKSLLSRYRGRARRMTRWLSYGRSADTGAGEGSGLG